MKITIESIFSKLVNPLYRLNSMKIKLDKDTAIYAIQYAKNMDKTPDICINEALRVYFRFLKLPNNDAEKIVGIINENKNR